VFHLPLVHSMNCSTIIITICLPGLVL
jgi:hypothetical protein